MARMSKDFTRFAGAAASVQAASVQGKAYADRALVATGGIVAGTNLQPGSTLIQVVGDRGWSNSEQEEHARRLCLKAFFEGLAEICKIKTVVLLIDTWERGHPKLCEWVNDYLLYHHCFDEEVRPARFVVVLAGQKIPDFKGRLGEDRFKKLVCSIGSLNWEKAHLAEFLEQQGLTFDAKDLAFLHGKIQGGHSLQLAILFLEAQSSESQRG